MTTGIRWLKIVLQIGVQAMITSLLLGVHPGAVKFYSHAIDGRRDEHPRAAEHVAIDPSRLLRDDIERIAGMRAIDVDGEVPHDGGVDIVGSPILFVEDDVLAAFDRAVDSNFGDSQVTGDDAAGIQHPSRLPRDASFDGTRDSDGEDPDEDDIDWSQPMFVRGTNIESSRELRVEAFDNERMHAACLIPGASGALAPSVPDDLLDLYRQRDPMRDGIVNFVL